MTPNEIKNLWQTAQTLASLPPADISAICSNAAEVLSRAFEDRGIADDDFVEFTIYLVRLGVSADRMLTQAEYDLWHNAFRVALSPQQFHDMTNGGAAPEFIEKMDQLVDSLDEETKKAACTIVMCFIAIDGEVTDTEFDLLVKLFD